MSRKQPKTPPSSFFGYLSLFYIIFILLASLYPFWGWKITGSNPLGFLFEPLPFELLKYNRLDILFNLIAYIPLGILLLLTLRKLSYPLAAFVSIFAAVFLSLSMETLQSFLPARSSSAFDIIWNTTGAIIGVVLMGFSGVRQRVSDQVLYWRLRVFESGKLIDAGIIMILFWFLAQGVPEGGLFATGDIELFFPQSFSKVRPAAFFVWAEAMVCVSYMLAVGMIGLILFRNHLSRVVVLGIFLVALLAKTVTFALYFGLSEAFSWVTPGAQIGLVIGTILFIVASFLPRGWQFSLGGMMLFMGVVLANFFPMNPYVDDAIRSWRPGNYVGLAGLTRWVSVLWPFVMFFYLYLYRSRRIL